MPGWTEHAGHFEKLENEIGSGEVTFDLEPEPPARCPDCGRSMYLADRDDNGICDECWEKKAMVTFDEEQLAEVRRVREAHQLQKELSERGPVI